MSTIEDRGVATEPAEEPAPSTTAEELLELERQELDDVGPAPTSGTPPLPPEEPARDLERNVEIAGRLYIVSRFKGYKATRVMREAAAIGRRYPKLVKLGQEFERDFIREGSLLLSRAEAELEYGDDVRAITERAWARSGEQLPIRRMPSPMERAIVVFPELFDLAESRIRVLLALIATSNEELEEWDREDAIDSKLEERGRELMHRGEVEELVELAVAGFEVGRAQFAPLEQRGGGLGKVLALALGIPTSRPEPTSEETTSSTSSTSSSGSETTPSSSTDSPPPSDGPAETSSSASPGSSSDASPSG